MKIANIKSIGLLAGLTLSTNLLGFVKEMFVARAFGTSDVADAFITAFTIVSACFLIFTAATIQSAFMPQYQNLINNNKLGNARYLFTRYFKLIFILMLIIVLGLELSADFWVKLIVPGFSATKATLTANVLRWLAPAVLFMGTSSILQSVLHARKQFLWPAIIPVLNNVIIISFLIYLVPKIGINGYSLAVLFGTFLWWLLVLPKAYKSLPQVKSIEDKEMFRTVWITMLPLLMLLFTDQSVALIQKGLVSGLGIGNISALNYGARISGLPIGVFSVAIATVYFPTLVDAISKQDSKAAHEQCVSGLSAICLFMIPAMFVLTICAKPLIHYLFERGAFNAHSTLLTANALVWYALGLLPQSFIVFLNRVYYSAGEVKIPMRIGIFSACTQIIFCYMAVKYMGYLGIALGTTVYAIMYSSLLFKWLGKIVRVTAYDLFSILWRPAISAVVMVPLLLVATQKTGFVSLIEYLFLAGLVYGIALLVTREPLIFSLLGRGGGTKIARV